MTKAAPIQAILALSPTVPDQNVHNLNDHIKNGPW